MQFLTLSAASLIISAAVTPTLSPTPVILATPVIGMPLGYTIPGYNGPITSQQWYWNTGSGPVLIPGATSATYTPSLTSARSGASDVGGFPSVAVSTPFGTWRSQEFSAAGAVLSQSSLLSMGSPIANHTYIGRVADTITVGTVAIVRTAQNSGTAYIDTVVAPGTYTGGGTTFGNAALFPGGTIFNTNLYAVSSLSPAACIAPATAKPATATRPGTSTGVGFFIKNGALYDANGNLFVPRGVNRLHWDANQPGNDTGLFNAKANTHRIFVDTTQNWTSINKPLMDAMVSNKVVPAPVLPYVRATGTATFSGTTMTVTAITGVIGVAPVISPGSGGGFVSSGVSGSTVILKQLTNTNGSGIPGKEGTYQTSTSNSIGVSQAFTYSNGTSGLSNPEMLIAAAQVWVDQYANWGAYERWAIINIANESMAAASQFSATISSTTMTVASGITNPVYVGMKINGSGVTPCTVTAFGTGTGFAGTYTVDVSQTVASATTMTDVTWRDTYITAVGMLRTAGYKGTIRIDAPSSGQDAGSQGRAWTLLNHAAAVMAADPQQNLIFSLHCYGSYQAGQFAPVAQALATLSNSSNLAFDIGEFGPANQIGEAGSPTTAETLEIVAVADACNLGRMDWGWDTPPSLSDHSKVYFADVYLATSNGYSTSNPSDLTTKGKQILLDPVYGFAATAVAATVFP